MFVFLLIIPSEGVRTYKSLKRFLSHGWGDINVFQTCQVGLNFANEEEAKLFRKTVTDLLGRRQRKSGKYLN